MSAPVVESKRVIEEFYRALNGKPKTDEMIQRYVVNSQLKKHIRICEAGFPGYEIVVQDIVAEDETVAVRAIFRGTHNGPFAGVAATGRNVSADAMFFYKVHGGRVRDFWIQGDLEALIEQLSGKEIAKKA